MYCKQSRAGQIQVNTLRNKVGIFETIFLCCRLIYAIYMDIFYGTR